MRSIFFVFLFLCSNAFAFSPETTAKIAEAMLSEGEYTKAIDKCKEALTEDATNEKCLQIVKKSKEKIVEQKKKEDERKRLLAKAIEDEKKKKQEELNLEKQRQEAEDKKQRSIDELANFYVNALGGGNVTTFCLLDFFNNNTSDCVDISTYNKCMEAFNNSTFIQYMLKKSLEEKVHDAVLDLKAKAFLDLRHEISRRKKFCQ